MADFCNQCAKEIDFPPSLVGLCEAGFAVQELCEGCGHCMVDHLGNCVTDNCLLHHKKSADGGWVLTQKST
jgi:hypothetical protein